MRAVALLHDCGNFIKSLTATSNDQSVTRFCNRRFLIGEKQSVTRVSNRRSLIGEKQLAPPGYVTFKNWSAGGGGERFTTVTKLPHGSWMSLWCVARVLRVQ